MNQPPVTICIDAGNTAIKVATFYGERLIGMQSDSGIFVHHTGCETLAREAIRNYEGVRCSIACASSKGIHDHVNDFLSRVGISEEIVWLSIDSALPFSMNYVEGRPGPDRIANVFALRTLAPNHPAVVVDFGTSTHIESTDAEGNFSGGLIMMGLSESRRALAEATSGALIVDERSFDIPLETLQNVFAFSTLNALNNGLLLQQTAAVEHFFQKAKERSPNTKFFATGGLAYQIIPMLRSEIQHVQELTLLGLREFADYHFKTSGK